LWLLLLVEAFFVAPPELPSTPGMLWRMLTFSWIGISPTLVALFWSVGVLWVLTASFLLTRAVKPGPILTMRWREAFFSARSFCYRIWPSASMARSMTPDLARCCVPGPARRLLRGAHRLWAVGILAGNLDMFWYEVETRKLAHVMVLDFVSMASLCRCWPPKSYKQALPVQAVPDGHSRALTQ